MTCKFEEANTTVLQYKSSWQSHNFILRFLTIVAINSHVWLTHEWNVIEKLIPVLPLFIWSVFFAKEYINPQFAILFILCWILDKCSCAIAYKTKCESIIHFEILCENLPKLLSYGIFVGIIHWIRPIRIKRQRDNSRDCLVRSTCQHDRKK